MEGPSFAHANPVKRNTLMMALNDRVELHACYMPFIKDGGLFIPTDLPMKLHDEVILQLRLVDQSKKLLISGRVVWLSPGAGRRKGTRAGIGLQFTGEHRLRVKQFIEDILGDLLKQPAAHPAY